MSRIPAQRARRPGAKPGDLPVEEPSRFELAVNLKTITALGLAVPLAVLLQADQVLE